MIPFRLKQDFPNEWREYYVHNKLKSYFQKNKSYDQIRLWNSVPPLPGPNNKHRSLKHPEKPCRQEGSITYTCFTTKITFHKHICQYFADLNLVSVLPSIFSCYFNCAHFLLTSDFHQGGGYIDKFSA